MKVTLSPPLRQAMPDMTVHVLLARGIQLDVLRYYQAIPPELNIDDVESLIVRWRGFYRALTDQALPQSPLETLLRCVMNQRFAPTLPLLDMTRYAALLSQAPLAAYALSRLDGAMTLTLAGAPEAATAALQSAQGEPIWLAGRQQWLCRALNVPCSDHAQLQADTACVLFIGEQPNGDFPSPAHGLHYLSATLLPLCRSLQSAVLDQHHPDVTF